MCLDVLYSIRQNYGKNIMVTIDSRRLSFTGKF